MPRRRAAVALVLVFALGACTTTRQLVPASAASQLPAESKSKGKYLKAHLRDGRGPSRASRKVGPRAWTTRLWGG